MARKTLIATKENRTGRNIKFQDKSNHYNFTRNEIIKRIQNPNSKYSKEYHIRVINNIKTPVSNPDNSSKNNLEPARG